MSSLSRLSRAPTPLYTTAITPTSEQLYSVPNTVGGNSRELSPPKTGASRREEEMVMLSAFSQSGVATTRAECVWRVDISRIQCACVCVPMLSLEITRSSPLLTNSASPRLSMDRNRSVMWSDTEVYMYTCTMPGTCMQTCMSLTLSSWFQSGWLSRCRSSLPTSTRFCRHSQYSRLHAHNVLTHKEGGVVELVPLPDNTH